MVQTRTFRHFANVMDVFPFIGSPVPSPEKQSPNKSPPHTMMKGSGFNPNAPSFIPMALQNVRKAAKVVIVPYSRLLAYKRPSFIRR